jgi:hypothetical protein
MLFEIVSSRKTPASLHRDCKGPQSVVSFLVFADTEASSLFTQTVSPCSGIQLTNVPTFK